MIFQVPVTLHSVKTTADSGLSITLHTPELNVDEIALLFALKDKSIWCAMKELPVKQDELKVPEVVLEKSTKTPSERLRSVLFVFWSQNKPTKTFEEFYNFKMCAIIDWIKEKLS